MKTNPGIPTLSDAALDNHIEDLQSQLNQLHISLQLATAERERREQDIQNESKPKSQQDIQNESKPKSPQLKGVQTRAKSISDTCKSRVNAIFLLFHFIKLHHHTSSKLSSL